MGRLASPSFTQAPVPVSNMSMNKRTSEQVESGLEDTRWSPNTLKRWRRLTVVVRNGRSMDCMSKNIVSSGTPVAYSPKYGPDSPMYDGPVDPERPSSSPGPDAVYQEPEERSPRSPKSPGFNPESPSYNPHSPQPARWDEEDEEDCHEDCHEDCPAPSYQPSSPTYRPQSPVV